MTDDTNPVILYVEDDTMSREVMNLLLTRRLKFEHVYIFEDSTDFAQNLTALPQKPDIIFLDIHMEPMDGFGMLEIIRAHPDYAKLPVIALTASVMNEEVTLLRTKGFDGALAKPVDQRNFPDILKRLLMGEQIWRIT
ncbi:MAG: response regulator [Phototrophicales bacterium]|nr:response regulator [Phototrophicales bacterium]